MAGQVSSESQDLMISRSRTSCSTSSTRSVRAVFLCPTVFQPRFSIVDSYPRCPGKRFRGLLPLRAVVMRQVANRPRSSDTGGSQWRGTRVSTVGESAGCQIWI